MRALPAARSPLLGVLAIAIVPILFHLTIIETASIPLMPRASFASLFKLGFVTASAVMHWSIYASLLATFGLSLRRGREPLITGMARRLKGETDGEGDDELAAYTRNVTIAWSVFFAAQLTLSVTLFCFAPLVVWSFFVNVLDIPLVVTMFAAEYAVRLRCLRHPPRHSLAMIFNMVSGAVRAAREHPAGPKAQ
jgi:uncharacterized membrane protein